MEENQNKKLEESNFINYYFVNLGRKTKPVLYLHAFLIFLLSVFSTHKISAGATCKYSKGFVLQLSRSSGFFISLTFKSCKK